MAQVKRRGFAVGLPIESATLVVLACEGELDKATKAYLDEAVDRCFLRSPRTVHVDCTGVTFLDSMGIRALMRAALRLRDAERPVSFSFNPRTLRLLGRAGLDQQLRPLPS